MTSRNKIFVKKSGGDSEAFDESKLKKSLMQADTPKDLAEKITKEISSDLRDGIATDEIHKKALSILKSKQKKSAAKYSLRRSLLSLGPTGFPFEQFVEKIFSKKGYQTKRGIMLQGECIEHEIDVVAYNDKELILCELKFHNELSMKTDTRVALYVKARFDDLKNKTYNFSGKEMTPTKCMIITNTKFTHNAIKYANCVGLDLVGWDYPETENLYDLMESTGLLPLTALSSLSNAQKKHLLDHGVINCGDLETDPKNLVGLNLTKNKKEAILKEIEEVC